jgi:FkbM family methyltransferase
LVGLIQQIAHDLSGAKKIAADWPSLRTYAVDVFFHRLLRIVDVRSSDEERAVRVKGGTEITYRRNRGDIYTLREIWIDEIYLLPPGYTPDIVVDLGAHIGLASLWFAKTYRPSVIVAVEPARANAVLARRNLERNGVCANVVQVAVGRRDATELFREARDSNKGRIDEIGVEVPCVTMGTLLKRLPEGREVDLMKIDVEGEEEQIFKGDLSWLARVRMIIAELHPNVIESGLVARRLAEAGFRHVILEHPHAHETQCFVRQDVDLA